MNILPATLGTVAFVCGFVSAQTLTVPAHYAAAEGYAIGRLCDAESTNTQVIIDSVHLTGLQNRTINAIRLRRDGQYPFAVGAMTMPLVLRIGPASRAAADAAADLRINVPIPNEVFRGSVSLPAAAAASGSVDWTSGNIVEIQLQLPYVYSSGNLGIEFEFGAGATSWWPVDSAEFDVAGLVQYSGSSCIPYVDQNGSSIGVASQDLVIGQTAYFRGHGDPGGLAYLAIGPTLLPQPIDLSVIGAAGCSLYLQPSSTVGTVFSNPAMTAEIGALAGVNLRIPASIGLLASRFVAQWIELGPSIRTSNAVVCTIAGVAPQLGMASITRYAGSPATVDVRTAPVLQFVTN